MTEDGLATAVRVAVLLNPPPHKKRDIVACEKATMLAFRTSAGPYGDDARAALRMRCRRCRFSERSPILE